MSSFCRTAPLNNLKASALSFNEASDVLIAAEQIKQARSEIVSILAKIFSDIDRDYIIDKILTKKI